MDWSDPTLYDLIINTEKLGIDATAKLIMEAAQSEQIKTCSITAKTAMETLAQTKKIEATLLKNHINIYIFHVEVPQKGVALISGWASSEEERTRLLEIVRGVPGISEVRSEISIMPAGAE